MGNISTQKKWWQKLIFWHDWNLFEKTLLLLVVWGISIFYVLALALPGQWSTLRFLQDAIVNGNVIQHKHRELFYNSDYRIALDTVASIAGIINIICLLYTSKKRIASFFFAIAAVCLLGLVAIFQGNVGTWVLSLCIELPLNIIGIFMWRRASKDKSTITPRRFNWWMRLILFTSIAGLVTGAYFLFQNDAFRKIWYLDPSVNKEWYKVLSDASILIIGAAAMTLTVFRFKEIWYLWLTANFAFVALNIFESNWALVFSWTGGLINSIYALITWKAEKAVSLKK